jgi:hypothetical protein
MEPRDKKAEEAIQAAMEFLCCCARLHMDGVTSSRLDSALTRTINWRRVRELSVRHRISPLMFWHLRGKSPDLVDAATFEWLKSEFYENTARNSILMNELRAIVGEMERVGVDVLPFKGPLLALGVYGSLGLRCHGDLDLLIRPTDLEKGHQVLLNRGYKLLPEPVGVPVKLVSERQYFHPTGRFETELRWKITSFEFSGKLDLDYLLPRATRDNGSLCLSPEALLLILCVHGAKHRFERLLWIADIAETVRAFPNLDWDGVARESSALGVSKAVGCGLLVAQRVLDAPIPSKAIQRFSSADCERLTRSILNSLWSSLWNDAPYPPAFAYRWRLLERPGDRARLVGRFLKGRLRKLRPNDLDRSSVALPPVLDPLYYVIRPIRLALRPFLRPPKP